MEKCFLLDTDKMEVLKVHRDPECLVYWLEILNLQNSNTAIRGLDSNHFDIFGSDVFNALYTNLTGDQLREFDDRDRLVNTIRKEIDRLEEDTTPLEGLKKMLGRPLSPVSLISDDDDEKPGRRKSSSSSEIKRPAEGTATRRVWDLADEVLEKSDYELGSKLLRSDIITTCTNEGIHASTAATQYSKWKRFNSK